MLTMIAQTMLPEAYFKGGSLVGFATLLGFLSAGFFKTLEPAGHSGPHHAEQSNRPNETAPLQPGAAEPPTAGVPPPSWKASPPSDRTSSVPP
jgi:hypothetical protein